MTAIRALAAGCTLGLLVGFGPPAVGASTAGPGAPGGGDSLFPHAGNGGYRVDHYALDLDYRPATDVLDARAVLRLRPTTNLSSLTLDLHRLQVQAISVGGQLATWSRNGDELRVRPASTLSDGSTYRVAVDYSGRPDTYTDPDGSDEGWFRTDDGSISVNEPVGAMTWFPVNNTPRDKATYDVSVTVPRRLTAVSNGDLVSRARDGDRRTWVWRTSDQMASYLSTVAIGRFDMTRGKTRDGTTLWSFVDPRQDDQAVDRLVPALAFLTRKFGPYPFTSGGLITDRADIGYALEVQDRPVFTGDPGPLLLVHELAHQWYGDSVTPRDWSDIWLNEGFATYAEWMWEARGGTGALGENFDDLCAEPPGSPLWSPPPADPRDPANLFGRPVYARGAMALQALRLRIGSADFRTVQRRWARQHAQAGADTGELRALAERVSGRELGRLFRTWLRRDGRPGACTR